MQGHGYMVTAEPGLVLAGAIIRIPVLITSVEGRFSTIEWGDIAPSVFSVVPRLEIVYLYVWQNRWVDFTVSGRDLSQPLMNRRTRSVHLRPLALPVPATSHTQPVSGTQCIAPVWRAGLWSAQASDTMPAWLAADERRLQFPLGGDGIDILIGEEPHGTAASRMSSAASTSMAYWTQARTSSSSRLG